MKIKWKIAPKETGRFASFRNRMRSWPSADWFDEKNSRPACAIACADSYSSEKAKLGAHGPLTVFIADYTPPEDENDAMWRWKKLDKKYKTLAEAKAAAVKELKEHPEFYRQSQSDSFTKSNGENYSLISESP